MDSDILCQLLIRYYACQIVEKKWKYSVAVYHYLSPTAYYEFILLQWERMPCVSCNTINVSATSDKVTLLLFQDLRFV
jgi:hypothetical protein